ncbi:MAG TPA: protein kinase [Planctomycetota bacterium]|nr:protein kinase [Planctomycetota bacterium]
MSQFELVCEKCGARYRLMRRPAGSKVACKRCKSPIELHLPPAERVDRSGESIGGYTLIKRIARGDRSDVYRAEQVAMRRTVALKVLGDEFISDNGAVAEFVEQAKLVGAMQHPGIVSVYEISAEGVPYYSMEFVEGWTVADLLAASGTPPLEDAIRFSLSAGSAITHALRHNVLSFHTDPCNIMLSNSGEVKMLPASLSAAAGSHSAEGDAIAALGRLAYALLTGKAAADSKSLTAPSKVNPAVPGGLDKTVLQMLKGSHKGFGSIVTAMLALKQFSADPPVAHKAHEFGHLGRPARKRKMSSQAGIIIAAACAAVLVAGGLAAWKLTEKGRREGMAKEVELLFKEKRYKEAHELAEEFIRKYPNDPSAAVVQTYVDESRKKAVVKDRESELVSAMSAVMDDAQKNPQPLQSYFDRLDAIARDFSDIPAADSRVQAQKQVVMLPWNAQRKAFVDAIDAAVRESNYAEASRQTAALQEFFKGTGSRVREDCGKQMETILSNLRVKVNDKWYELHNEAWAMSARGEKDEALKVYQSVVEWNIPEFTELARQWIDKIQGKEAPAPEPDAPNKQE